MGFEVLYNYHERLEEGGYNKDETKQLKKKYGDAYEDFSLEKLASGILVQLARRDIWVTNVEIHEYKKTKVNFRETKGGIVIKNRKFLLDSDNNCIVKGELVDETTGEPVQPHNVSEPTPNVQQKRRPIKWVLLDEAGITQGKNGERIPVMIAIQRAGLQLSANKKYPVFAEMDDPRDKRVDKFGQPALDRKKVYQMWDNHQREVIVSQDYFVSAQVFLEGGRDFNTPVETGATNGSIPKLMFEGEVRDEVPDLRARR
jgi:hypothetical protein